MSKFVRVNELINRRLLAVFALSLFVSNGFATEHADRVVVEKAKRLMTLYKNNQEIAQFHVAIGQDPVGQKNCRGDNRTPEGQYSIVRRKADSNFYRALQLSYPSPADIERAKKFGCEPGSNIMIHGLENGYGWVGRTHRSVDWTNGCVAVTNEEMDKLWELVKDGTQVEIRP